MFRSFTMVTFLAVLVSAWLSGAVSPQAAEPSPPLQALIVGGGPDVENNAAQIEGHVRYVAQLLPASAKRLVLFTDGKADSPTVSYSDNGPLADAQRALSVLLSKHGHEFPTLTRAPELGARIDGPSRWETINHSLAKLLPGASRKPSPLLLYFAGHGSLEGDDDLPQYDLWDGGGLTVRELSEAIARVPGNVPVVLVMAQCYSGAFGDVLFREGRPDGELVKQNIVGFFSARKDRMAAGCGLETEEADYQDFSSYFFGALSGQDRFGKPVSNADFDENGSVGMHEAFCFALIHDVSFDTPVCTSDVFLRRFAHMPDEKVYETPYREAWESASAAQRAALDALSERLSIQGERRALAAHDRLSFRDPLGQDVHLNEYRAAADKLNLLRERALATFFQRWPALRWSRSHGYQEALHAVTGELADDKQLCRELIDTKEARDAAESAIENDEAWLLRFLALYESIVLTKNLREHGKEGRRASFERLWEAEQKPLQLLIP